MHDDDEERTPVQTPSALHKLGLACCPKCKDLPEGSECDLCSKARRVTMEVCKAWLKFQGLADSGPPSAEPSK